MSEFENVLSEYKEQTKPMCEALDCLDLLDDFLVDIELSRAKYHHFYQAGQQSQQAKIDQLNEKHSEEKIILHNVIEMNQAKIDELQAKIDVYELHTKTLKNIHDNDFKEHSESSYILGNLDGFFECLESDLKGNKDEN